MKSQDIVVLLKLISLQDQELAKGADQLRSESLGSDPYWVRNLEAFLGISKTKIAPSMKRSIPSGIARKDILHAGMFRLLPSAHHVLAQITR